MFCGGEREREREREREKRNMQKSNSLDGQDEKLDFSLMSHYGTQESIRFHK